MFDCRAKLWHKLDFEPDFGSRHLLSVVMFRALFHAACQASYGTYKSPKAPVTAGRMQANVPEMAEAVEVLLASQAGAKHILSSAISINARFPELHVWPSCAYSNQNVSTQGRDKACHPVHTPCVMCQWLMKFTIASVCHVSMHFHAEGKRRAGTRAAARGPLASTAPGPGSGLGSDTAAAAAAAAAAAHNKPSSPHRTSRARRREWPAAGASEHAAAGLLDLAGWWHL